MIKIGKMWILEGDDFFRKVFTRTGDKFEDDVLMASLKYVEDWSVAVEVGAHYGSWTRILAEKFDKVIAIEGSPENFACLLENTKHLPNVECINKAVGDRFDNVDIGFLSTQPKNNSGGKAVIGDGNIPMITIDSLNLPKMGFMKMDIEGYEVFAIRGGEDTILKYKPVMTIEDNVRNEQHGFKVGDTVALLKKMGAEHIEKLKSANHVFIWNK